MKRREFITLLGGSLFNLAATTAVAHRRDRLRRRLRDL
jgi:hypothetical protein